MKHAILPLSRRDRRCETSLCTKLEEGREEKKKEEGKRRKERGAGRRKGKGKGGGGGGRAGGRGRGEGGQVGGRSLRRRGEAGRATAAERRCGEVAFGRARHVVAGDEQGSLSLSLSVSLSFSISSLSLHLSLYSLSLSFPLPFLLSPSQNGAQRAPGSGNQGSSSPGGLVTAMQGDLGQWGSATASVLVPHAPGGPTGAVGRAQTNYFPTALRISSALATLKRELASYQRRGMGEASPG